jgi:hypothetical protein
MASDKLTNLSLTLKTSLRYDELVPASNDPQIAALNKAMADRVVGKLVKEHGERLYEQAGLALEASAAAMNLNVALAPGQTATVYDNGLLCFIKSVKHPAKVVDAKKLASFLLAAGVDKVLIDQATAYATTERKAATYLTVTSVL